LFHRYLSMVSY